MRPSNPVITKKAFPFSCRLIQLVEWIHPPPLSYLYMQKATVAKGKQNSATLSLEYADNKPLATSLIFYRCTARHRVLFRDPTTNTETDVIKEDSGLNLAASPPKKIDNWIGRFPHYSMKSSLSPPPGSKYRAEKFNLQTAMIHSTSPNTWIHV